MHDALGNPLGLRVEQIDEWNKSKAADVRGETRDRRGGRNNREMATNTPKAIDLPDFSSVQPTIDTPLANLRVSVERTHMGFEASQIVVLPRHVGGVGRQ